MNDLRLDGFKKILSEIEYLKYTLNSLLYWDKITHMPKNAFSYRNEVMSYIGEILYGLLFSEELGQYVNYYKNRKDNDQLVDMTIKRIYQVQEPIISIPEDEYREYTKLISFSERVWNEARLDNEFMKIIPYYERIFSAFENFANYWGYENEPYDALVDYYVEGYTTEHIDSMVDNLKEPLLDILEERLEIQKKLKGEEFPSQGILKGIGQEKQRRLWELILEEIGFNFDGGRLDLGTYTTILANSPDDVRIVNEYSEENLLVGIFNILHSGGKAIYHQNIDRNLLGSLLAEPPSFVMEEAIGRFYENIIGRSRSLWERILPRARKFIPELEEVSVEEFYQMLNYCQPSPNRMNADEITYLLHIIIRYEMEKLIFRGQVAVGDLEDAWNLKYKEYLNVQPRNVREGILQDVHWAAGYLGYFPTYILASVAATQFASAIEDQYGNLEDLILEGGMDKVNQWLHGNIFKWGAMYDFQDLIERVCHEELNVDCYLLYLKRKFL